jgi:hypothetical protein
MQRFACLCEIKNAFDLASVLLPTSLLYPNWTFQSKLRFFLSFCELASIGLIESLDDLLSSKTGGSTGYMPMVE